MPLFKCRSCGTVYPERCTDGAILHHTCAPTMHDKKRKIVPREVIRDENWQLNGRNEVVGIRDEGEGVECVSGEELLEPVWISAIKQRLEKEDVADA